MRLCWLNCALAALFWLLLLARPLAADERCRRSPENPTIVLGMLGTAGISWRYIRARQKK